ncbi:IQUB [Symbiodinium pilosum]|uniref:IQUB protein n=1 Tax=Symbiodinium pilosum TaxID=2952 RepID=A0A812W951_SYMPI|nr:IQUB [Symbiodinium pilosum]
MLSWEHLFLMLRAFGAFRQSGVVQLRLFLTDPQLQDSHWNLDLPELRRLSMSNHVPPVDKFAQSLLQCPKIEIFYAHKYWNDHPLPELFLPSRFTFRRGDCTRQLKLYLPQVEELILDANYELESLVFLKQGHPRHAAWNVAPSGPQSKFILSCVNANLGKKVKQTLIQSGRLLNTLADAFGPEDDEFGQGPMFGMDAFWKHARPGLFPDCNGPGEDDSDPPRAVPADQQSSRGAMAQGGQRSADQGPVGKAVWVAHLKSRPELVGRSGVIVQQFAAGRVGVRFDHDKTLELSVKMENLEFLPDGQQVQTQLPCNSLTPGAPCDYYRSDGLISGHAYAVLDAREVILRIDQGRRNVPVRLIALKNPHGDWKAEGGTFSSTWLGEWGHQSSRWQRHPEAQGAPLNSVDLGEGRGLGA